MYCFGRCCTNIWCRRRDSNSHDRGPLPPQDSVSTNSTTSAVLYVYLVSSFFAAVSDVPCAELSAGACSAFCSCSGFTVCSTAAGLCNSAMMESEPLCAEKYASVMDVAINIMAEAVVILFKSGNGPSLPKSDWEDPPNEAPISAPFPCCNNTMAIRNRHTATCMIVRRVIITFCQS